MSDIFNQKNGVYNCFVELYGVPENNKAALNKDQQKELVEFVAAELFEGRIEMSTDAKHKYDSFEKVRTYSIGLVNNWLRKDVRLNGGDKYTIKSPGSRTGASDPIIKNLKALKSHLSDPTHIQSIDDEIAKRLEEIKPEPKLADVDYSVIPDHIKAALGIPQ